MPPVNTVNVVNTKTRKSKVKKHIAAMAQSHTV